MQAAQAARASASVSIRTGGCGIAARVRWVIAAARAGAAVACASCIARTRPSAAASIAGICPVSGMFFQYFSGICCRIEPSLMRAGLKILAKYVAHSASAASSGRSGRGAPGAKDSAPSCQIADRSGVWIAQSMSAKRRQKNPAFASTIRCSGSNHAAKRRRGPSAGSSRKRTKARILWMSRRTALSSIPSRRTSGSAASASSPRRDCSRSSAS